MRLNKKLFVLAGIPVLIAGWALFRPELLFVNQTVNEKLPEVSGQQTSVLSSGTFASFAHETTGMAQIVESNGKRVLRLSNFKTSNGPDVRVLLVRGTDSKMVGNDFVELGALKGNIGDQNYAIPDNVDLSDYQAVNIYCKRFSVGFGGATLAPQPSASVNPKTSGQAILSGAPGIQVEGLQLTQANGTIEVTYGRTSGSPLFVGHASIIEEKGQRFVNLNFKKIPAGSFEARLVKKETLATGAFPSSADFIPLGNVIKSARVSISKEIDAWLYRSIAILDKKSKKVVAFIHLRSAQEMSKKTQLI